MKILICIDDTDNLDSRGTGDLAEQLASEVQERSWGCCEFVTRHQLLVHPDVPYTSHNSSMCFAADIDEAHLPALIERAKAFLVEESAPGSDPGLAVAVPDRVADMTKVVEFGKCAKKEVLNKKKGGRSSGGAVQDVLVEDPVCHTYIPKGQAVQLHHDEKMYYFCSDKCCQTFLNKKGAEE